MNVRTNTLLTLIVSLLMMIFSFLVHMHLVSVGYDASRITGLTVLGNVFGWLGIGIFVGVSVGIVVDLFETLVRKSRKAVRFSKSLIKKKG